VLLRYVVLIKMLPLALAATNGEINRGAGIGTRATDTDVEAATTVHSIVAIVTREFIVATLAT
jgi:hypothetical protein